MAEATALLLPINATMADHALRHVRTTLERAQRGDQTAVAALVRMNAAPMLEASLKRMASAAHACAPSLDEIKINRGLYTLDQHELRFAADNAAEALSAAAGRAVPNPWPQDEDAPDLKLVDGETP